MSMDEAGLLLRHVRVPAGPRATRPADILISAQGRILEIGPGLRVPGVETVDLAGCLAVPGLVDMHQHLDKSSTLAQAPNPDGTLLGAIGAFRTYAERLQADDIIERAQVTLDRCVAMGAGAIRAHTNVDYEMGLRGVDALVRLREANRHRVDVQIVAFMTSSAARGDPDRARVSLEEALAAGADCIGGTPNLAPDPRRYLDMLLDTAEKHGRLVDVHIDETLDPEARWFDYLVEGARRRSLGGRVVASHVCALSARPDDEARRAIEAAAEAGVGVCTLPAANLFLQGRGSGHRVPRGLTRVTELLDAGVTVATASDNIQDAFVPVGAGDPLEIARWTILAAHLLEDAAGRAFDMVTAAPARLMGLDGQYGLRCGAAANLLLTRCEHVEDLVAGGALARTVLHQGRVVAGSFDAMRPAGHA
ncbi:amidohydrolase family protein [Castellaniella hirudinis]|uniref:Amidohydrolase family protein n=1 Tax=Castellaniella hirudinis TaxID=1144617 RepID=A0ABV8S1Y6_9BURK